MSRIDALTAIGKKFSVEKVETATDGKITIWLHRPIHLSLGTMTRLVDGTGYTVAGYGNDIKVGKHYIQIIPLTRGQTE